MNQKNKVEDKHDYYYEKLLFSASSIREPGCEKRRFFRMINS